MNSAVSGITALDKVHVFQWMISRPIVTGTVSGLIMGDIAAGMLCGACIELVWLGVLPIGNYTPPDAHAAAACAGTAAAIWHAGSAYGPSSFALLAVLCCIPAGILSKSGDFKMRKEMSKKAEEFLSGTPPYDLRGLGFMVCLGMFLKTGLQVLAVGVIAIAIDPLVNNFLSQDKFRHGLELSASFLPALGMVQLARCIGARGRERYVGAGAVVTLMVYIYFGAIR
ncbi:MAG: PTS sugar transporter subunit IIC [Candidatus Lindowbacteria bacterium]|nr:PTS sugar transporter subunit IIC [Candidatus Lindowbacteria bacterium]